MPPTIADMLAQLLDGYDVTLTISATRKGAPVAQAAPKRASRKKPTPKPAPAPMPAPAEQPAPADAVANEWADFLHA